MATYHIDIENGKTKFVHAAAYASNPSGSTVRITYPAIPHCLSTGEQVVLSLFTAYLNGTWTITVVNDYQFDLNGATWAATADPIGTCTPVNMTSNDGSSWALAKRSMVSEADAIYKIRKSPDAVNLGITAQWTYRSKTVTLASALTQEIDPATTTNWVASSNISLSTNTSRKYGASALRIYIPSSFLSGKVCYRTLPSTLDLSSFDKISLWAHVTILGAELISGLKICLCSDSVGNTVVDTLYFNPMGQISSYHALTLKKGSALGSSINSVAIYTDYVAPSFYLQVNNIFACSSLTLNSLIGKSNSRTSQFYPIQSINGTTIILDNGGYNTSTHPGYDGTTENVDIYAVTPLLYDPFQKTMLSPTANNSIRISGGWNSVTDEQDGISWIDLVSMYQLSMTLSGMNNQHIIEHIGFVRGRNALGGNSIQSLTNVHITGVELGSNFGGSDGSAEFDGLYYYMNLGNLTFQAGVHRIAKNILSSSNSTSNYGLIINTSGCYYENIEVRNHAYWGLQIADTAEINYLKNVKIKDPLYSLFRFGGRDNIVDNLVIDSTVTTGEIFGNTIIKDSDLLPAGVICFFCKIFNKNRVSGTYEIYSINKVLKWQTAIKHGTEPGAWSFPGYLLGTAIVSELYPPALKLAEIAVEAGVQITIRAWVYNAQTSDFITIRRMTSFNIDSDYYTYAENKGATWQELGITLIPERSGVITLEFRSTQQTYIGSISMT